MTTNPYLGSENGDAWAQGFALGLFSLGVSPAVPEALPAEAVVAFGEGVAAGDTCEREGFPVETSCYDLSEEEKPPIVGDLGLAFEALMVGEDVLKLCRHAVGGLAGSIGGGIILAINASIDLETFYKDPASQLGELSERLNDQLTSLGVATNLVLYCGGGLDYSVAGCQMCLTNIHTSLDRVHSALAALGRPGYVVVSWRSDQSGGLKLEESNEP
jgi:hypothetical protein